MKWWPKFSTISDRSAEGRFLNGLEDRDKEASERVKALMFTFDDLGKLDPGAVQTLLRHVDKARLGLALKGATEALRDLFFTNLSERAGKIMLEEMDAMGPVRLSDIDEAQMEIVNQTKGLAASGEILIADTKDNDELVY